MIDFFEKNTKNSNVNDFSSFFFKKSVLTDFFEKSVQTDFFEMSDWLQSTDFFEENETTIK